MRYVVLTIHTPQPTPLVTGPAITMHITSWEQWIRQSLCPGCRNDRYNHPGIEDGGSPVTSEKCYLLGYVKRSPQGRPFVCPYRVDLPPSRRSSST